MKAPLDIGITDANPVQPLDVSGLPVFAVTCTDPNSPLLGQTFNVTDPRRQAALKRVKVGDSLTAIGTEAFAVALEPV